MPLKRLASTIEAVKSYPFFSAPHRVMFAAGTFQAVVAMALWAWDVGGRYAGLWSAHVWPFPSAWLHAMVMIYGVFPFFVFGFILTAGPRWQGGRELEQWEFIPAFLLLVVGWGAFYLTLWGDRPVGYPLLVVMLGWLLVAKVLWGIATLPGGDRTHIRIMVLAVGCGIAGLACAVALTFDPEYRWGRPMVVLGIWGFLLPIFAGVGHRMIPFFSSAKIPGYTVYSPLWAIRFLVLASFLHGVLEWLGMAAWTWMVDFPAASCVFFLSWRWKFGASLSSSLLAVLHIGFAWLGIALLLFAVRSTGEWFNIQIFGLAPLHALTIGYFASTAVGMVSRVTRGHSGRPVIGDPVMIAAFSLMQLAALLRILGEFAPVPGAASPMFAAAVAWLLAFCLWAAMYFPIYLRRRADGRPG